MSTTKYHFNPASSNKKTGPIPVTTTSKDSCPTSCAFYEKGCYAKNGPLNIHWNRVAEKGISQDQLMALINNLPAGQLWRHNQAGDLPHNGGNIDYQFIRDLCIVNQGKKGFTYTHHEPNGYNIGIVRTAIQNGFTINLSANDADHAVELAEHGLPVGAVVPSTETRKHFEYRGEKFLTCPATYRENMTCARCGLCQKADRKYIVAFPAHGSQKKHIDKQQQP